MPRAGCLSFIVAAILMVLLPLVMMDLMSAALLKLHLTPDMAVLIVFGVFAGSLVNLPVRRIVRSEPVPVDALALFGLPGMWPRLQRVRHETIIAVNVGGCLIPVGLAAYEAVRLIALRTDLPALATVVLLNVWVCHRLARPVAGVGITLPALVPPAIAATGALLLAPANATPVAFIAGVLGPLVGADLLHLRDVDRAFTGLLSIGGAGTFDGILLSGIVALYLA
ncbi:MAG TPA: DUF1614 domain-containing protein [Vicinamibacterales bacterium]|nr:DUF1614 domain-containing protein [Vicinamibacterales bacterium]